MKTQIPIIIFVLVALSSNAQKHREELIKNFDKFDIYPNSKNIKTAYKVKNGLFDGYAIDFTESGDPIMIGQYKSGKRIGKWIFPNGHILYYDGYKEVIGDWEGAEFLQNKQIFDSLYAMFIFPANLLK